jgi:hypothetical protein
VSAADAEARLCRLDAALGRLRPCSGDECPFWEPGGAVLHGRCVFDGVDFSRQRSLVASLRELRSVMEAERTEEPPGAAA